MNVGEKIVDKNNAGGGVKSFQLSNNIFFMSKNTVLKPFLHNMQDSRVLLNNHDVCLTKDNRRK
ncbi:MAG: hypothetical protein L6265_10775 [Thermoplasmatales archaeon]|nr:hypothetical protein [Candidatus Thermoplasmatota archaeon]MCG2827060.1 hypothetical protein [Thermoplasmatales archaeon]